MKLSELAFACYIYSRMTDYDRSYSELLKATNSQIDIRIDGHRFALLRWLNSWGCRQFAIRYHDLASEGIRMWYEEFGDVIFSRDKTLLELSDSDISLIGTAYENLSQKTASRREIRKGVESNVMVGSTGASKILFALRPSALAPLDDPVRKKLKLDSSANPYINYLGVIKSILEELGEACERNGYSLSDLPNLVGRPNSSLVKLVDECFWVTISRKCPPPTSDDFVRWIGWQ
jgi:hypothetical protein